MSPASKEEVAAVVEETRRLYDSQPPRPAAPQLTPEREVTVTTGSRFAWPVVVALLGVAAIGAVGLAQAQDAGQEVKAHAQEIRALQVDSARNTEQHAAILEALKEIKSDLKELKAAVKK